MGNLVASRERPRLLDVVERLGHVVFEKGNLNLNIIAERKVGVNTNLFDDSIHALYKLNDYWHHHSFPATADPGRYWVASSSKGAASLVPGQYRGAWTIGKHRGQYEALVQRLPVKVYRDRDRDGAPDRMGKVDEGIFGINFHRANAAHESTRVDKWSAGCLVFGLYMDFDQFMGLVRDSSRLYGKNFTATLIETRA